MSSFSNFTSLKKKTEIVSYFSQMERVQRVEEFVSFKSDTFKAVCNMQKELEIEV